MIARFHGWLVNMPIRRKLLAINLMVALLIGMIAFAGFRLSNTNSNRLLYTQTAGSLGVLSDKIGSRLENILETSLYVAVNKDLQSNLEIINEQTQTAAHGVARSNASEVLYRTINSDILTITVFPRNGRSIVWGTESSAEDPEVLARIQQMAEEAKGAPVWLSSGRADGSVLCAREIRNVGRNFLNPMGFIMFRVDLNRIIRETAAGILTGDYDITITQGDALLHPYLHAGVEAFDDSLFSHGEPYAIHKQNGEVRFFSRSAITATRMYWSLILGIPYDDVFHSLILANILFAAGIFVAVLLAVPLSRGMLRSINRNIRLLMDKMDQVRGGNLEPYPSPRPMGGDELGKLNLYFDEMTADFKQVIEDNYVKELLLTQTQLKALEQQINPHFLYNSLESINWFARRGEGANVSAIAQALGQLLRGTLSEDGDRIPLSMELSILESYLRIQRIRFPDTLVVHTQVDDGLLNVLIPKMSIQPLVENAIVHSLEENVGECHIRICVKRAEDKLVVEVENDGSEIDVDILAKLRAKQVEPKGHGVGMINIDSRIKLLFGQEYGLGLESREDHVTVFFAVPAEDSNLCHADKKGD